MSKGNRQGQWGDITGDVDLILRFRVVGLILLLVLTAFLGIQLTNIKMTPVPMLITL